MVRLLLYVFDLIVALVVGRLLARALQQLGIVGGARKPRARGGNPGPRSTTVTGKMVRDPVCGMFVSTELSHCLKDGRETLHFCSEKCLESYKQGSHATA